MAEVGTIADESSSKQVTITGIDGDGDTPWFWLEGEYEGTVIGTFNGASLDLETRIPGPGTVVNVGDANFLTITSALGLTSFSAGAGEYRYESSSAGGSTSLVAHFRRISR